MEIFLNRMVYNPKGDGQDYVNKEAFMTRFWSAYTYDEITEDEVKVNTNKFLPGST
jgi:hypothetical protein